MTSPAEALYRRLPVPLQNVALTAEGYRITRRRYGPAFQAFLQGYLARGFVSEPEIAAYRDRRLRAFVRHAATSCRYYRQAAYRSLNQIETADDLQAFPMLTKDEVRAEVPALTTRLPGRPNTISAHTSGTTGAGLIFPVTIEADAEQWAVWWRYRRWHGLDPSMWSAHFGGRSISSDPRRPSRVDLAQRRLLLSSYHTTDQGLDHMLRAIGLRGIQWLHGYPSFLTLLAQRARDQDWGPDLPIRWVTTGAENLSPYQQDAIALAFGVRPVQHYGLREGTVNISECPLGSFHIDEDFSVVEVVNGELVGTNVANLAFPLIRYRSGDLAERAPTECSCGRPGRTVTGIDGRLEDYLVLTDGARIGRLDHIFKDATSVAAAQFRQEEPGMADLLIVPTPHFTDDDSALLLKELDLRLGGRISIQLHMVESIPTTRSGKLRLVVRASSTKSQLEPDNAQP